MDLNRDFYKACFEGNMNMVESLISRGANDWAAGLRGARAGGHAEIVEFVMKCENNFRYVKFTIGKSIV